MQLTLLLFDFELSETATSSMFTIVNHWKCLIFLPANTENIPKINQIKVQYNQSCCHTTYKHLNTIQICISKLKRLFKYNYLLFITRSSSTYLLIGNELHFFQALPSLQKTINECMIVL